jgi:putative membrane protein
MLATILVAVVAFEHFYFMVLEMFLWTTPRGRKAFGMTEAQAQATATLAGNQGLYNGFLAAGLLWSLTTQTPGLALPLQQFFLACVIVAGVYGALTAKRAILYIQAFPAALALLAVMLRL